MPLFFFDHRDGDELLRDEEGMEFASIEEAREEATRGLGGIARDALPGSVRRELAIEVSDASRKPLFRTALWFEVQALD
jgi:hypothetical protein